MSEQAYTPPPAGRSASYLAIWALLASIALGYLALLAIRPDLASSLIVGPSESTPESNRGQRAMTKALAELSDVKKTLAKVEGEISALRQQMADGAKRSAELEARVLALEAARRAEATPIAAAPAGAFQTTVAGTNANAAIETGTIAGAAVEAAVTDRGSKAPPLPVAKAAAMAAAAKSEPKEKGPPVALLVGTGPSVDALRLSWQLIQDTNGRLVKSLEPRYVESPTEPGAFQLFAGPVESKEEAQRLCQRLKAKQVRCSVSANFAGQPL